MIRTCRIRAGLTQAELASRLGVDRTSITKWETGGASPRTGKLLEIARELGCTVEELLCPELVPTTDDAHSNRCEEGRYTTS